jgi:hypothetical protein
VQIIADSYWPPVWDGHPWPGPQVIELSTLLDSYAQGGYRLENHGNVVRLRSRTWYFDRPPEITLRLVRGWRALHEQQGAPSLTQYAELVSALRPEHFSTLRSVANLGVLPEDAYSLESAQHLLRLYAALVPAQQQALWQRGALLFARMTPQQRDLFLTGLAAPGTSTEPAALADARLTLTREALVRTRQTGAGLQFCDNPAAGAAPAESFHVTALRFGFHTGAGPAHVVRLVVGASAPR